MYTNRHISDVRLELLFQFYEHYSDLDCNKIFRNFMQCIYFKCSKHICLVFSRPQALHGYFQPGQLLGNWSTPGLMPDCAEILLTELAWAFQSWLILPCRLLLELWPSHCRSALRSARTGAHTSVGHVPQGGDTVPTVLHVWSVAACSPSESWQWVLPSSMVLL